MYPVSVFQSNSYCSNFDLLIVNAKVHGLKEIFNRLDRRTYPLPTGNDVANYLKWFQQTLQRYC